MPYCPGCGHQHADDDRFCSKCGRAFVDGAVPTPLYDYNQILYRLTLDDARLKACQSEPRP
jgi:predicted amidophosphoribosyltransferase